MPMRAIPLMLLAAVGTASAAPLADECDEFRTALVTEMTLGDAFNRAALDQSDDASAIGIAYDNAVDVLHYAEVKVSLGIHKHRWILSDTIAAVDRHHKGVLEARDSLARVPVKNSDTRLKVWQFLFRARVELGKALHQTILLACEEAHRKEGD